MNAKGGSVTPTVSLRLLIQADLRTARKNGADSSQLRAFFRSEGPIVSSPVREGGELHPPEGPGGSKSRHKPCRTFGAYVANRYITPPSRTGLLTIGPSDLKIQIEPVPAN